MKCSFKITAKRRILERMQLEMTPPSKYDNQALTSTTDIHQTNTLFSKSPPDKSTTSFFVVLGLVTVSSGISEATLMYLVLSSVVMVRVQGEAKPSSSLRTFQDRRHAES